MRTKNDNKKGKHINSTSNFVKNKNKKTVVGAVMGMNPHTKKDLNLLSVLQQPGIQKQQKRRVWKKVSMNDRLKLECAVEFGLPVDFAGKVVGIESSNTDRIIKDLKQRRANELNALSDQSKEQRDKYLSKIKQEKNEAKLQALLSVATARDSGLIKKRNILKMDKKVNEFLIKYLHTSIGINF